MRRPLTSTYRQCKAQIQIQNICQCKMNYLQRISDFVCFPTFYDVCFSVLLWRQLMSKLWAELVTVAIQQYFWTEIFCQLLSKFEAIFQPTQHNWSLNCLHNLETSSKSQQKYLANELKVFRAWKQYKFYTLFTQRLTLTIGGITVDFKIEFQYCFTLKNRKIFED